MQASIPAAVDFSSALEDFESSRVGEGRGARSSQLPQEPAFRKSQQAIMTERHAECLNEKIIMLQDAVEEEVEAVAKISSSGTGEVGSSRLRWVRAWSGGPSLW